MPKHNSVNWDAHKYINNYKPKREYPSCLAISWPRLTAMLTAGCVNPKRFAISVILIPSSLLAQWQSRLRAKMGTPINI